MIAWADHLLERARRRIRLREPQRMTIITGSEQERIDATYDEGNRLVHLIVHTRHGSLSRPGHRVFWRR